MLVWLFELLMLPFLGFPAGTMMFLVIDELIPEALQTGNHTTITWCFIFGFSLMLLVQVVP